MLEVKRDGSNIISIAGEATVFDVQLLHDELRSLEPSTEALKLDLDGLTRVDVAGLQVLLALVARFPSAHVHCSSGPIRQLIDAGLVPEGLR